MAIGKKTGGRQKGTPNKATAPIREMIIDALDRVGGVEYLANQAIENPSAFMTLVGKVLPLQVTGRDNNPIEVSAIIDIASMTAIEAAKAYQKLMVAGND